MARLSTTAGEGAQPDAETGVASVNDTTRPLSPAAQRASDEAARRRAEVKAPSAAPKEIGGRVGLEPVRYGDWEGKGLASDF